MRASVCCMPRAPSTRSQDTCAVSEAAAGEEAGEVVVSEERAWVRFDAHALP